MNNADFEKVIDEQLIRCQKLLTGKGHEYAEGADKDLATDRLAHFKKAAAIQAETPEAATFGMLAKHLVSIADMTRSKQVYPLDRWDEKITDSINYLLILRAIVEERKEKVCD